MPLTPSTPILATNVYNQGNGQYFAAGMQDKTFMGGTLIAGVALPVMAASLASKFTLYNPASSGVVCEPIMFGLGITSATTVVNGIGYAVMFGVSQWPNALPAVTTGVLAAGASQAAGGAVANGGTSISGRAAPRAALWTTLTLANAAVFGPVVYVMGGFAAITDTAIAPNPYAFNGSVLLPPDSLMTFVTNVAAETAAALSLIWAEW